MSSHFAAAVRAVALALFLIPGMAFAHAGHDHGDAAPAGPAVSSPRGETRSDAFELVAVSRDGILTVYLDRRTTNEPVNGAEITVEAPAGPVALQAAAEGSYSGPADWLSKPGAYDLLLTVTVSGTADVLSVTLTVPQPGGTAASAMQAASASFALERLIHADRVLLGVAAVAFLLGVAITLLTWRRRLVPAFAVLALTAALLAAGSAFAHGDEDHNAATPMAAPAAMPSAIGDLAQRMPDGSIFVPKPTQRILAIRTLETSKAPYNRSIELPGRIIPDPNASGVVQSTVGGRVSAPEGGFPKLGTPVKKGAVLAFVTPPVQQIDVSDMRQRQGELDQQLIIVKRRVERYRKLAPSGAISQVALDEAVEELRGLTDRRSALDKIRLEPEPLIAPVDGIIAESTAVAGQMAAPGAMVFQVVDPARLWVEGLSFEPTAGAIAATARLPDGRTLALAYQGAGFADRNQSVPVQFAITDGTAGLRVGQFVTIQAATSQRGEGLALPRGSIVRSGNGQDVVYEHTTAERFVARPVRITPLDGERVLVAAGLNPGQRVVTQGAELLDQVR